MRLPALGVFAVLVAKCRIMVGAKMCVTFGVAGGARLWTRSVTEKSAFRDRECDDHFLGTGRPQNWATQTVFSENFEVPQCGTDAADPPFARNGNCTSQYFAIFRTFCPSFSAFSRTTGRCFVWSLFMVPGTSVPDSWQIRRAAEITPHAGFWVGG